MTATETEATDADGGCEFENETEADPVDADELTVFQQNLLLVIRGCEEGRYDGEAPDGAIGLAIKRVLETSEYYDKEINHSRLYQNLDTLVDYGLVVKSELDRRTNECALTKRGRRVLAEKLKRDLAAFKGKPQNEEGDA